MKDPVAVLLVAVSTMVTRIRQVRLPLGLVGGFHVGVAADAFGVNVPVPGTSTQLTCQRYSSGWPNESTAVTASATVCPGVDGFGVAFARSVIFSVWGTGTAVTCSTNEPVAVFP